MPRRRRKTRTASRADQEFVSEAEEILERMREDLADLSDQRAGAGDVAPDLVNRLFRSAHSFKALAGMFGYEPIQQLAHDLEDILDSLRLGRVALGDAAAALLDETVRHFAKVLESVGDDEAVESLAAPAGELADRLRASASESAEPAGEFDDLDLDPALLRALTEYEEHRLRENLQRGRHVALVESAFEILAFEEGLSELSAAVRGLGEVLSTLPAPGEAPESEIRFSLLTASDLSSVELQRRLDLPHATVRLVRAGRADAGSAEAAKNAPAEASADTRPPAAEAGVESLKSISDTVRVDIRKLDELMNLVGELVIQRGAIGELLGRLLADSSTVRIGQDLSKVYKSLDRKLRGLQSAVLDVRMVPLRQVFERVSRVVRGLRRDLGKDAALEIRGADTELDKLIVEELVDPLMHIVRNSLDHAIESAEERLAAGKDARGHIRLEAFQRGNHVVIAVSDDGAGIDTDALRASAEAAGLVAPDEVLSERETLDLVFSPGLSTRSEVTETSGRGVGMDVVRSNLTALGGVVEIESTPGRGTTISMTLPITLAIIQSLIVGASRQRFAIPLTSVLETLVVDPAEIQQSEGRELLNLRGEPLLLRRLAVEFGIGEAVRDQKRFVVVVGLGELRLGLVVDRLEGQRDTVIKSVRGIAGATELGDGDPVPVLDVSSLVEDALRRREAA